jgi:acyl carrier protein
MHANGHIVEFFKGRDAKVEYDEHTPLEDMFDSLDFIDFFLYLEGKFGSSISLERVTECATVGNLVALLDAQT